jgi:hypothetical protein
MQVSHLDELPALKLAQRMALALKALHSAGLVHSDVKVRAVSSFSCTHAGSPFDVRCTVRVTYPRAFRCVLIATLLRTSRYLPSTSLAPMQSYPHTSGLSMVSVHAMPAALQRVPGL